jgi:uncharacterized membrane protein YdfJ with MMPL/SSD domain
MLLWLIGAIVSTAHPHVAHCGSLTVADCKSAAQVGGSIAVGLIVFLWAAVDVILGAGFLIWRATTRRVAS